MSQTIDSRVVQMQFDNKQFESGAAQSMGTLKNLDKALNGVDGAKAFADISRAAGNVDLSGVMNGVSALQDRFSVMGTYVHNTLLGMVESAANAGKQIANALVLNPAKTGFSEYELQIKSVQRILANTKSKGEDINSVNAALDELNEYADLTIYNFGQMTDNIGRFTAAGVDLDDSVRAIKGLSNAAALFGADSMVASRAGYQLSQALASGTIKLMDWNSLVNANMGGEKMQEAIMRVARHHGVAIDAMIEKEGSFRDTLSQGWLTSDMMLEALSHFTMVNDEASRSALEASGYTQQEIDAIIELGETATQSATDVLGFTQLMGVVGEELGSVWSQTWRAIVGDYEEAKTTFTEIKDEIKVLTGAWAEWQVGLVEGWAELGGRTDLFDSIFNVFNALKSVLGPIGQAFADVFPPITAQRLADLTRNLKEFTQGLILNESQMARLKSVATTVFSGIKAGLTTVTNIAKSLGRVVSTVVTGFAKGLASTISYIGKINVAYKPISEWINLGIKGVINFANAIPNFVNNVLDMAQAGTLFENIYNRMPKTVQHVMGVFQNSFKTLSARVWSIKQGILQTKTLTEAYSQIMLSMPVPVQKVMGAIQNGYLKISNTFKFIRSEAIKNRSVLAGINSWIATLGPAWQTLLAPVSNFLGKVQVKLLQFREVLLSSTTPMEMFTGMLTLLPESVQNVIDRFGYFSKILGTALVDSFGSLKKAFSDFFNVVIPNFGDFWQSLRSNIGLLGDDFSNFFSGIGDAFKSFISSTPTSFDELKQSFVKLKDDILFQFTTLKEAVSHFFKSMSDEDGESILPKIGSEGFKSVVAAFEKLQDDVSAVINKWKPKLTNVWNSIWSPLTSTVGEKIGAVTDKIKEFLSESEFGRILQDGLSKALSGVEGVLSKIFDSILSATGLSVKSVLGRIKDSFVNSFTGLTKSVGDSAKKTGRNVTERLREGVAKMPEVMESTKNKVVEKTKLMGAHIGRAMRPMISNTRTNLLELKDNTETLLVDTFNNATTNIQTIIPKMVSAITTGLGALPETMSKVGSAIKSGFTSLNDFLARIPFQEIFSSIGDGLKNMYESVTGLEFSNLTDSIKKGFDWLVNGGAKQIVTALLALDLHGLLKKWKKDGKALAGLFDEIADSFKKLGKIFSGVSAIPKNFNKALRSMAHKNNAEALKDVAKAVAIFAGSIWLLSSIPWENMKVGLIGFGVAVAVAVGAMAAFAKMSSSMAGNSKKWSLTKKGLTFESSDYSRLTAMATAMIGFAAAVGILALSLSKIGGLGANQALQGIMGLVSVVAMLVGSMKMLSDIDAKGMNKLLIPMVTIGLVVKMLAGVIADISALKPGPAAIAIGGIALMLGSLSLVLSQLAKVQKFSLKAVIGVAAIALVIRVLQPVIAALSTLNPWGVISVCGGLALLMIGIGQVIGALNVPKFKANLSILSGNKMFGPIASFALLIGAIGGVIFALSKIENPNAAIVSATALAVLLVIVGALLHHINDLENIKPAAAATVAAFGIFVTLFANAIAKMALVYAMNPIATVAAFVAAVSALAVATGTINRIPDLKNMGAAVTMVALGAFVSMFATAVSIMATLTALNPIGAIVSTIACCAALAVLLKQINNLPDIKGMGAAASILAIGVAMNGLAKALIKLSELSVEGMLTGLVGVGGLLMELSIAIGLFDDNDAGIAGLRKAGMAFMIVAVGMNALSRANPGALIANLLALGVALFAFSKGAKAIQAAIPAMTGAATAFTIFSAGAILFSGAVALLGVGLQSVAVGIAALSASVVANIGVMTAAFTGLLYAFIKLQPLITQALVSLVQIICDTIVQGATEIAEAIASVMLAVLDKTLEMLPEIIRMLAENLIEDMKVITEYAPQIAEVFTNMFVAAVDALTPKIPIILEKLGVFLHALLDGLMDMLRDLATADVEQAAAIIAAVIGVAALIGKFTGIFMAALKGIAMLAVLVVEIGAVVAAFGAIAQIPGVSDLVTSGGELLGQIGYAIGNFVGSIIGGLGAGATSGLPTIATNLSTFATNITPFVDYMKSNGSTFLTSIGQVVDASIKMKDIKDVKAKKLVKFADSLNEFAVPFRAFCDSMDGINVDAVNTAALAAKRLAEMVQILSESGGGLEGLIAGNGISLEDFGKQLEPFGKALKTASESFADVKGEAILNAVPAAEALAELAGSMYRTGGAWQKFVGEHLSLDNFGTQVDSFATALKDASESFENVKVGAIEAALPAATALADLAGEMVRFGGTWQKFTGEKTTLSGFGAQVSSFGTALAEASTSFENVKTEAILNAIPAAQALSELASAMETEGGVEGWWSGDKTTLTSFGADLKSFAEAFVEFGNTMSTLPEGISAKVTTIVASLESLASIKEKVTDLGSLKEGINRIANMKDNFTKFGEAVVAFSGAVVGIDTTAVQNAQIATECITAIANGLPTQEEVDAIPDLSGLQTKFSNMATSIQTFGEALGDIVPEDISGAVAAFDEVITLVNRINSINISSFSGLAEAFKNAATNAVNGFKTTISGANVTAVVNAFFMSAKSAAVAHSGGLISSFKKPVQDANQAIRSMASQFSATAKALVDALANGVTSKQRSVVSAFTTAVTAAKNAVASKSSVFFSTGADLVQGLINGINSKKQAAINAGTSLGQAVSNATKSATQVGSPSRVFYAIGRWLDIGLANGIIQNADKATSASREMARGTIAAMQDELRIDSPSKVAKDEVGHWIVEGIAEGIEEDMSAEEAAEKKAENIVNAFQEALDKIDLEFASMDIDRQIIDLMDITRSGVRNRTIEKYLDEIDKAQIAYEYKKGAYDTLIAKGLAGTDKEIEARNAMKEAELALLKAQQEYNKYILSNSDRFTIADKMMSNSEKELEILKKMTGSGNLSKQEQELLDQQKDLAEQKATYAYDAYQAALKTYGEDSEQALEAYSTYLEAKQAFVDLFTKDQTETNDENKKTSAEIIREWADFWKDFKDEAEANGWTVQQIAELWGKDYGYNPVTFEWMTGKETKEMNEGLNRIEAFRKDQVNQLTSTLQQVGATFQQSMGEVSNQAVGAATAVATTYTTTLANAGSQGVTELKTNLTNDLATVPAAITTSNTSDWQNAGLSLIQAMTEGAKSGKQEFVNAINQIVKDALTSARSMFGMLGGITKNVADASLSTLGAVSTSPNSSVGVIPIEATPVIDFNNLIKDVNKTNKILGQISVARIEDVSSVIQNGKHKGGSERELAPPIVNNYEYTQNNYSPKALSNAEIYRQSKNMFAMATRKKG